MFRHFSIWQRLFLIIVLSISLIVIAALNNIQSKSSVEACLINKNDPSCSRGAFYICQILTLYSCNAYKNLEENQKENKINYFD